MHVHEIGRGVEVLTVSCENEIIFGDKYKKNFSPAFCFKDYIFVPDLPLVVDARATQKKMLLYT